MKMRVVTAFLTLMPLAAWPVEPEQCQQRIYSSDFEIDVQSVQDLGQGVVMETTVGQSSVAGSKRLFFEQCVSGQVIRAVAQSWDETGSTEAPVDPLSVVAAGLASATPFTLADLVAQLSASGVEAELIALDQESCGCAVFYPDQRGDKPEWIGP